MYKNFYNNSSIGTIRFDKGFLNSSELIATLIAKNSEKFISEIANPELTETQKINKLTQLFKDTLIKEGEQHG